MGAFLLPKFIEGVSKKSNSKRSSSRRAAQRVPNISGLPKHRKPLRSSKSSKNQSNCTASRKKQPPKQKSLQLYHLFERKASSSSRKLVEKATFCSSNAAALKSIPQKVPYKSGHIQVNPAVFTGLNVSLFEKKQPKTQKVSKKMLGMLNTQSEHTFARTHVRQKRTYVRFLMSLCHNLVNSRKGLQLSHPSCKM